MSTILLNKSGSVLAFVLALVATPALALEPSVALQHLHKAQSDAKAGKFKSATSRLEWLIQTDADNASRTAIYQKALRQLIQQKPLTFAASGTVLSSTNVRQSSSEDIFHTDIGDFTIGGDEAGGVGVRLGASANWRHFYALGREISATAKLSTSYYDDVSLRSTTPSVTFTHRWLTAGGRYSVSVVAADTMYPTVADRTAPDNKALGVTAQSQHALSKGRSASLSMSWIDRSYDEQPHLDGATTSLGASLTMPVSDKGKITVTGGWSDASLTAEHLSYDGPRIGIGYAHQTKGGLGWSVNLSKAWRDYDDIFTALSYAREDDVDTLSIGLSHRDIKIRGMVPRLTCSARQQTSNVALYTYDAVDCSMSLNHAF